LDGNTRQNHFTLTFGELASGGFHSFFVVDAITVFMETHKSLRYCPDLGGYFLIVSD
jgi:hypothetical protein